MDNIFLSRREEIFKRIQGKVTLAKVIIHSNLPTSTNKPYMEMHYDLTNQELQWDERKP